jgi:hypothetical protein
MANTNAQKTEPMPPSPGPAKRSAMFERISHCLVGLTLVMKGVDKAEHFSDHPLTVLYLFAAGAFIILGTAFHHALEKRIRNFVALFHVAEGTSVILVGLVLLEKSSRLPYFLFFIGAAYLGLGGFEFFTDAGSRKRLRPVLLAVMAAAFLVAAALAVTLNLFGSKNTWVFITAGVMAVMAAYMLLARKKAAG